MSYKISLIISIGLTILAIFDLYLLRYPQFFITCALALGNLYYAIRDDK